MSENPLHRSANSRLLSALLALKDKRYVSVSTFRKSGETVATPVEFVMRDGALFFLTLGSSGKVKRLRHNSDVKIAPCTIRGKVTGPGFGGRATLLDEGRSLALREEFAQKYGLLWRIGTRLRAPRSQA
jgi:PPOX class probable F420-dependent enzyme